MKKKVLNKNNSVIIYQTKSGALEFKGDFKDETVWATQAQIAEIFDVTSQNITQHISKIYKETELPENPTCKDYLQVQIEGGREITRKVKLYNFNNFNFMIVLRMKFPFSMIWRQNTNTSTNTER